MAMGRGFSRRLARVHAWIVRLAWIRPPELPFDGSLASRCNPMATCLRELSSAMSEMATGPTSSLTWSILLTTASGTPQPRLATRQWIYVAPQACITLSDK